MTFEPDKRQFSAAMPEQLSKTDSDGPLDILRRDVRTGDVGQTFDGGAGRIFPCESCGSDLEFNIGEQAMKCPYCGHVKQIERRLEGELREQDFHAMLEHIRQWREESRAEKINADPKAAEAESAHRELRCDSCGGNVEFYGTLTSTFCPYCGSPMQLEKAHKSEAHRIPVDGILPFQIDYEHAKQNLTHWVNSRWFAPSDLILKVA